MHRVFDVLIINNPSTKHVSCNPSVTRPFSEAKGTHFLLHQYVTECNHVTPDRTSLEQVLVLRNDPPTPSVRY